MKKLLITSALFIGLISSVMAAGNDKASFSGANAFKKAFPNATNISVKDVNDITKISFTDNNENLEAFYSAEGELVATSKHIRLSELPGNAGDAITKKYADWTITEAIEFDNEAEGSTHYYVNLQQDNKHMIIEVAKDGKLSMYKK